MQKKRSLVFIDLEVPDYQVLLTGITPETEVYFLHPHQDGMDQITALVQGQSVESIHLVGHGYPGGIELGHSHLNLDNLEQYREAIEQWQCSQLVIYGCQVGSKSEFIEQLHQITGATVAASEQEVGPQWNLGVVRGVGKTDLAFSEEVRESYQGVLATFTVTNTEDDGIGSLRQAIRDANDSVGGDEIIFNPSLTEATIGLTSGVLEITDEVIITGLGADQLTVDAQGNSGVFYVDDGDDSSEIEVSLSGLTITGADFNSGIRNEENLTITDTTISGNSSEYNSGGGIYNNGDLTISNSTISGNSSESSGGGIYNNGDLTISSSSISGNSSAFYGGGIFSGGELTISNSTISDNSSEENGGGGISNQGELTISNSTISGNSSESSGGGISNRFGELITISNSTISGNSAQYSGGGISNRFGELITISNSTITLNQGREGGGLASNTGSYDYSALAISNTIISGNLGSDVDLLGYGELTNNITSNGGNLIGTGNAFQAFDQPGDAVGVTRPGLEAIADNGGPTLTHALQSDSPAVNNGINSLIPADVTTDQRGLARIVGPTVDIGAFESEFTEVPIPTVALLVTSDLVTEGGLEGSYRLSRTGSTDNPLSVALSLTGSSGLTESDFTLSGVSGSFPNYTATIPSGESFLDLVVTAPKDAEIELVESLTLDFVADSAYRIGSDGGVVNIVPETIVVTNTNDSGPGSLREAVTLANGAPGNNFIEFDPSLAEETIVLTSRELEITDDVIITGLGADQLTLDAQGNSRVFTVYDRDYSSEIEVSLSGLTITGADGDGVENDENLTITDTTISGNSNSGIANVDGELTISNSTISDNSGDGIVSFGGQLNISNSTISGNGRGGIFNSGDLNITNSIISSNSQGGIFNGGDLTITNSTISGNSSEFINVGGIYNRGDLTISNSTITLNQGSEGGGLASYISSYSYSTVSISNTIISGNLNSDVDLVGYGELTNNITSLGGNLIGTGNAIDAFNQPSDQLNSDPGLEPLGDNGGPTLTHALQPDSPGVDTGDNSLIPEGVTTDQRGLPRIAGGTVDIGAFELQDTPEPQDLVGTPGRDTLVGGAGNDSITGLQSGDLLTGGGGEDLFIYTSVVQGVDTITDFEVGLDTIVLTQVLSSLDYTGLDPLGDGYLTFLSLESNTLLQLDPDGTGSAKARPFILVENLPASDLNNPNNFTF